MRILVAPNAFKECLTASEAALALARGARKAGCRQIDLMPVADGGDGLAEALLAARGGRRVCRTAVGPLGRKLRTHFAVLSGGRVAVVEMSQASGLRLVPRGRRNPLVATSYGTGELIRAALDLGVREVWVGLGGSATQDGGAGMAEALGARFLDARGKRLPRGAEPLSRLSRIDLSALDARILRTRILGIADVVNPLLGPRGSARVFGPQKGATPGMVRVLERALGRYARVLRKETGRSVAHLRGAGAAGGLGAGLVALLGARLEPGAARVLRALEASSRIRRADLVFTGEGKLDRQSLYGKAPFEVARWARRAGKPVWAFCGRIECLKPAELRRLGIVRAISLEEEAREGEDPFKDAARILARSAEQTLLEE